MWARLERGDKVAALIQAFVRHSLAPNLHNRGANQSDASFGFHGGGGRGAAAEPCRRNRLLPALPAGWSDGAVTGLRARGGFEVA